MRFTIGAQAGPHATRAGMSAGAGQTRVAKEGRCRDEVRLTVEQACWLASSARAREGVGAAQSAIDCVGLTVDVGGIVAGEKQCHGRDFARLAVATQRVELADLAL